MWVRVLAVAGALTWTIGCQQAESPSTPSAEAPPAAPKPPPGFYASMYKLGPITAATAPTVEAIGAVLAEGFTARKAEAGLEGAAVQVMKGDEVVLEVFASEDGARITRVVTSHALPVFPWNTRVGQRLASQKNWDRMTCAPGEGPFAGKAVCHAYEAARIRYVVEGWEGEAGSIPGKELMADLQIAAMVWEPKDGDAAKVK